MVKGVVIMKSINLQNQRTLNYSQVFLNQKEVKHVKSYRLILQNKLNLMSELISVGFSKLINFFDEFFGEYKDYEKYPDELAILSDIVTDYIGILKNENHLLSSMFNQLEEKEMNKETFELLLKIINYQIDTTKELVNKELTVERIHIVYNHLREVPYYLKTDLELDDLPSLKSGKGKVVHNIKSSGWQIVKQNYDPDEKYTA